MRVFCYLKNNMINKNIGKNVIKNTDKYKNINESNNENSIIKYSIVVILLLTVIFSIYICMFKNTYINEVNEVEIYNKKISSYIVKYNVMIVSNKNINNYTINEVFKNIDNVECFKFNFFDALSSEVTYIVKDNFVKISSANQINEYITNVNKVNNLNLLSTKTYLDILNSMYNENNNNCYYLNEISEFLDNVDYDKVNTKIVINLDKNKHINKCNENCNINDLYNKGLKLNKIEIILDENNYFKNIRIYSQDLLYMEIEYDMFKINEIVDDNLFNM